MEKSAMLLRIFSIALMVKRYFGLNRESEEQGRGAERWLGALQEEEILFNLEITVAEVAAAAEGGVILLQDAYLAEGAQELLHVRRGDVAF